MTNNAPTVPIAAATVPMAARAVQKTIQSISYSPSQTSKQRLDPERTSHLTTAINRTEAKGGSQAGSAFLKAPSPTHQSDACASGGMESCQTVNKVGCPRRSILAAPGASSQG